MSIFAGLAYLCLETAQRKSGWERWIGYFAAGAFFFQSMVLVLIDVAERLGAS